MILQKKTINNVPTLVPLTADTGSGVPVGTIIGQYKKVNMAGYLYLDGSTFDQTLYPALYAYLGTNVLPDYREFVLVGAEQNATSATIHDHDVFTQGQEKDDQLQNHGHKIQIGSQYGVEDSVICGGQNYTGTAGRTITQTLGRSGTTTRTKEKAVFWYIKATTGIIEPTTDEVFRMLIQDHRNIFRGRCLNGDKNTLYPTTPFPDAPKFTGLGYSMAEILAMITDGSFRDVWTGDYFIDFNDNNRVYRIVDLDAYYNRGNRTVVNKHHIVVVPDYAMDNTPWNSSGNTNDGYPSSTIRSVMEGASVQGKFEGFFGSSHLIPMEALVPAGESWAWSQDFSGWTPKTLPMTEVEVYGSSVFGNGFQTGTGCSQFAGFKLEPRLAVGMRYTYWLISIFSSSRACVVYTEGCANSIDVPYSLGCRPRVLIG